MPFTLIEGTFHVTGYQPDGDSLRFKAKNKSTWQKLGGRKVQLNKKDMAQLRFEGVDSLETHYGRKHQPLELANAATDFTLQAAGITNIQWGRKHARVSSANDGTKGYILSRTTERYRRPVAFVFAGSPIRPDATEVTLKSDVLKKSINYKLVEAGLAYPTYYDGLFHDLRETLTAAAVKSWNLDKGNWPYDWTNDGFPVTGVEAVEDTYAIMPKLFRRIVAYLKENNNHIRGFKRYMEGKQERVLIIAYAHSTHFDTVIEERGNRIRLTVWPEDLMFYG